MRIVLLTRSLEMGGAERQLSVLAKGLHERGHEVAVLVFYGGGAFNEGLTEAGVKVVDLKKRGRWDVLPFLWKLWRFLRSERPHVLYSFLTAPNLIAGVLKPVLPGTALVWGYRVSTMDMAHYDRLARWSYRLEGWFSRVPAVTIANSESGKMGALERGFPQHKLRVVFNGIDTSWFRRDGGSGERIRAEWGMGDDAFLIGLVARLDPMKDHPTFLRAASRFHAQWPKARFVCIGDGPPETLARLKAMADELGLSGVLQWPGARGDLPAVYSSLDVFTLSSAFGEGFPNVVGEAMACEVPCVVTDVGDAAQVTGETGIVVRAGDDGAISEGWENLAAMESAQRREIGRRARARIEARFSRKRMIEETEACLTALLNR